MWTNKPNHSYYQGSALDLQNCSENVKLTMCCDRCGADQGKCWHSYESDYILESKSEYDSYTAFIRNTVLVFAAVCIASFIIAVALSAR